ncbi:histone-lysine N-methyltransferase SETMAR [Trichonephila clavipes]|nr:histone-lysine N-methyltransferase SETMAR [Trichonephila clavipes]
MPRCSRVWGKRNPNRKEGKLSNRRGGQSFNFFTDLTENASQATGIVNDVYGADTITSNYMQFWFRRFRSGIFDFKNAPHTGRPVVENFDKITEIIELDRHFSSLSIAQELKIDHKKILNHLRKVEFKKKLDVWVSYTIDSISICEALAERNEIFPFLKRMVTGDEKWDTYDNIVRKRSWSKRVEAAQTTMYTPKILFASFFAYVFLLSDLTSARPKKDAVESHPLESNERLQLFGKSEESHMRRRHPSRESNVDEARQFPAWTPPSIPNIPTIPNGGGIPTLPSGGGFPTMPSGGGIPTMPNGEGMPTMPGMPNERPTMPSIPSFPRIGSRSHPSDEMEMIESRQFPGVPGVTMPGGLPGMPTMPSVDGIPTAPGMPNMPNGGGIPTMPSGGGVPTMPGMPNMPNGGGLPTMPSAGGVPTMPGMPNMPNGGGIPTMPSAGGVPTMPGMPNMPNGGGIPTMPSAGGVPTMPGMPNMPNGGGIPTMPSGGGIPTMPGMPNMPNGGGIPTMPSGGGIPTMPNMPNGS